MPLKNWWKKAEGETTWLFTARLEKLCKQAFPSVCTFTANFQIFPRDITRKFYFIP